MKVFLHMVQGIQEWAKKNLWKTAFKNFEVIWSALADRITSWLILEYLDPYYNYCIAY